MIVEFPAPANCAPRSYAPGLMQQARRAFYESSDARGTAVERPAVVGPRCLDPNNPRHRPQNTDTLESWFKVGWRVETVGGFAQKRDVSGYLEEEITVSEQERAMVDVDLAPAKVLPLAGRTG